MLTVKVMLLLNKQGASPLMHMQSQEMNSTALLA